MSRLPITPTQPISSIFDAEEAQAEANRRWREGFETGYPVGYEGDDINDLSATFKCDRSDRIVMASRRDDVAVYLVRGREVAVGDDGDDESPWAVNI